MSLDPKKLEKLVTLPDGMVRARCPACAENGQDRKGEHLRVYPDGRFGCCVFPRDRAHRARIFAIAGQGGGKAIRDPNKGIQVRTVEKPAAIPIKSGLVAMIKRASAAAANAGFGSHAHPCLKGNPGTSGTGFGNSDPHKEEADKLSLEPGTSGTPLQNPRVCNNGDDNICSIKEFHESVLAVPKSRFPYFTASGTLVIPFDSPERYHWWKGGQSVSETFAELRNRTC